MLHEHYDYLWSSGYPASGSNYPKRLKKRLWTAALPAFAVTELRVPHRPGFFFFFLFSFLVFLFACHKFFHDEYLPASPTFCHSINITFHLIYYTYMQDSEVVRINYWFYFVQNYAYSAKCRTEHLRQHLMASSLLVHNSGCAQRTQWTKHKWWQRCLSS